MPISLIAKFYILCSSTLVLFFFNEYYNLLLHSDKYLRKRLKGNILQLLMLRETKENGTRFNHLCLKIASGLTNDIYLWFLSYNWTCDWVVWVFDCLFLKWVTYGSTSPQSESWKKCPLISPALAKNVLFGSDAELRIKETLPLYLQKCLTNITETDYLGTRCWSSQDVLCSNYCHVSYITAVTRILKQLLLGLQLCLKIKRICWYSNHLKIIIIVML